MYVSFTADKVGTDEDDGVVYTGIRGGEEYLIFSRGLDDKKMDDWGVYLEYRDQVNGGYDCIEGLCPRSKRPRRRPDEADKEIEGFHVALALSDEQRKSLAAGLRKVFRDAPVLKIAT